ncbi:MAG: DUF3332 domain-containing protein [Salinivirgaceae bacterium]|nr:DUF3332 domain-containing protein [Salinivirgaceae bacterium]
MKKMRSFMAVVLIAAMGLAMTGCYGSFGLTQKVHSWNGSLGNKFVEEIVFIGLCIIPVYELATFADAIIFNTIEFWTGSNPIAFKQGVNEIEMNGQKLTVNVVKDNVVISNSNGDILNELIFNNDESTWYSIMDNESRKLMTIQDDNAILYTANGETVELNMANKAERSKLNLFNAYATR